MINIYHRKVPEFLNPSFPVNFPEGFLLVATVSTDNLETAFRVSNHIESDWTENEKIECYVKKARSSSVGDVFECISVGGIKRFMCESIGWIELTKERMLFEYLRFFRTKISSGAKYDFHLIHDRYVKRLDEILREF